MEVQRAYYATGVFGDAEKIHEAKSALRELRFDPIVVHESKDRVERRQKALASGKPFEKPKGCDVALATQMVADAGLDLYDSCLLFTSDADFIPAIQAVRTLGKNVWVYGFDSGLGKNSEFAHVPDRYFDLSRSIRKACTEHARSKGWELTVPETMDE
jgi:uncharacterized LabA/DUF88 family protein